MENQNADEKPVENSQEGVENEGEKAPNAEETVTLPKAQVDELIEAAEKATALAAQKSSDAENYQKGMMKYKTLLKDNGIDDEEPQPAISEDKIAQIVAAEIAKVVPQIKPESNNELELANKKIEEMRIALANSKHPSSNAAGSNVERDASTAKTEAEKFFSPEQIAEIKRKFPNADIEAIYKNMPKNGEMKGAQ